MPSSCSDIAVVVPWIRPSKSSDPALNSEAILIGRIRSPGHDQLGFDSKLLLVAKAPALFSIRRWEVWPERASLLLAPFNAASHSDCHSGRSHKRERNENQKDR